MHHCKCENFLTGRSTMENTKVKNLTDYRLKQPNQSGQAAGVIASPTGRSKPKLLDQVREAIRTRHYSPKTEESYVHWIKRFIFFHNKRHPIEVGEKEIAEFLSSLASDLHVSASTQNQALNAILFLYREVLRKEIGYINGVVREATQTTGGFDTTGGEIHSRHPQSFRLAHVYVDLWSGSPTNGVFGAEG